jgi:hypothetical protein
VLASASAAVAASLPSGRTSGAADAHAKPPQAPQLEKHAPFCAPPLLVSGTDAYRDGEYLYQDYLFDDRGADIVEGPGGQRDSAANFSPTSGNVFYPRVARYAQNAARAARQADA